MLWLSILVSLTNFGFSSFWMEGMKPPLYRQCKGPSSGGWEYSVSGRQTGIIIPPDMGGTYPFHCPLFVWPCQPQLSSMSGHILLGFTIHQHQ